MIANAFLGNERAFHTFKFNPSTVAWNYTNNTRSLDTLGGRVVQVLSSRIDSMSVQGLAGSRSELQRLAKNLKDIMNFHIQTQEPVLFKVPSKDWNFRVYLQGVSNLGWSVQTVVYPYQLEMMVIDDLTGIRSRELETQMLDRLAKEIGYNPNVHGGNAPAFTELVNNLQLEYPNQGAGGADETTETVGPAVVDVSGTAAIKQVVAYVYDKYPRATNLGIYNCKKIQGSDSWSQHSWANALDIGGNEAYLNEIAADLLGQARSKKLPIAQILWQKENILTGGSVYDHEDHIHISASPMFTGTPPCSVRGAT